MNKESEDVQCTAGMMNLHNQRRKEYDIFNINGVSNNKDILLLQIGPDTFEPHESNFDDIEAEYSFLTENMGWKEVLSEPPDDPSTAQCQQCYSTG